MFNARNAYKNGLEGNPASSSRGLVTSSFVIDDVWSRNDAALAAQQEHVLRMKRMKEKKASAAMSKQAEIQRAKERFSQMHKSNKREVRLTQKFREAPTPPPLSTSWNQVARKVHDATATVTAEPKQAPKIVATMMVDKAIQTEAKNGQDEQLEFPPCLRMNYSCNAYCKHIPKDLKLMVPFFLLRKTPSKYEKDAEEKERMRLIDRLCNPFGKKPVIPIAVSCTSSVIESQEKQEKQDKQDNKKIQKNEGSHQSEITDYMREFPSLSASLNRGRFK